MKEKKRQKEKVMKDGTVTKKENFDFPVGVSEKLTKLSKKTGISKKFLVIKGLELLFLEQKFT